MKKYLLIVAVFVFGLSLAACSGGQKAEKAEGVQQEQVDPAVEEADDAATLDEEGDQAEDAEAVEE